MACSVPRLLPYWQLVKFKNLILAAIYFISLSWGLTLVFIHPVRTKEIFALLS